MSCWRLGAYAYARGVVGPNERCDLGEMRAPAKLGPLRSGLRRDTRAPGPRRTTGSCGRRFDLLGAEAVGPSHRSAPTEDVEAGCICRRRDRRNTRATASGRAGIRSGFVISLRRTFQDRQTPLRSHRREPDDLAFPASCLRVDGMPSRTEVVALATNERGAHRSSESAEELDRRGAPQRHGEQARASAPQASGVFLRGCVLLGKGLEQAQVQWVTPKDVGDVLAR
jgi:hypothetical protein